MQQPIYHKTQHHRLNPSPFCTSVARTQAVRCMGQMKIARKKELWRKMDCRQNPSGNHTGEHWFPGRRWQESNLTPRTFNHTVFQLLPWYTGTKVAAKFGMQTNRTIRAQKCHFRVVISENLHHQKVGEIQYLKRN
jgi:hypothetical protein